MNFLRRFSLVVIPVYLLCGWLSARTASGTQAATDEDSRNQDLPVAFTCPMPEGQGGIATLRIVVDTKGNISEVKALDGPQQVLQPAESCAKTWKYERPPSAPQTKIVELAYTTRLCPARESQRGDMQWSWGLLDRRGEVVAYLDGESSPRLLYPEEERKAGAAGRMVLSVSLNADGTVKDVHAIRGL